jgi:hypothetical protein
MEETSQIPAKVEPLFLELGATFHMQPVMTPEDLQPEAAYFTDVEGTRGGFLVLDMDDSSQMPAKVEPLFLELGATLHMQPVMTPEDLRGAAGEALQQMAQKYG